MTDRVVENVVGVETRLEDLTPGARVRGVLPDRTVTLVQEEWHGTQALTLTYRDDEGRVGQEIPYREAESRLEIEEQGRAWSSTLTASFTPAARTLSMLLSR